MALIFLSIYKDNTGIKLVFTLFAIFILATMYYYPDDIINIQNVVDNLSPITAFFIGILLSLMMIISSELSHTDIISPVLLFLSIILILPALFIPILSPDPISIYGTAGKIGGVIFGYLVSKKFRNKI